MAVAALTGCDNGSSDFVDSCQGKDGMDATKCQCVYDTAEGSLSGDQLDYFLAIALGDTRKASQIQAGFGLLDGANTASKVAWVTANLPGACGVEF